MHQTNITGNGTFPLTKDDATRSSDVTIYSPAVVTGTVSIGYLDALGVAVPYTDGALVAGDQLLIKSGYGVKLVAIVTAHTADFSIGLAESVDK